MAEDVKYSAGQRIIAGQFGKGTIRFVGSINQKQGTWIGIQLDKADGKNDGSVQGVHYFTCEKKIMEYLCHQKMQQSEL